MHSVNGAQFLDIIPLLLSFNRFASSSVPPPSIVIVSLTSIYPSLYSNKLYLSIEFLNLI